MSDAKRPEELSTALATAAVAAAQAAMEGKAKGEMALAAGLSLLPAIVGKFIPAVYQRKERDAKEWWDQVVWGTASDCGVAAEIRARADDSAVQDVVVDAFKSVLEANSSDVLPALAMLTREYVRTGRPRDAFFSGVGTMLTYLSSDEYRDLRLLITGVGSRQQASGARRVVLEVGAQDILRSRWIRPQQMTTLTESGAWVPQAHQQAWIDVTPEGMDGPTSQLVISLPTGRKLFQLLKAHGIATEGSSPDTVGPDYCTIETEVLRRIAKIIA